MRTYGARVQSVRDQSEEVARFWARHADAEDALSSWFRIAEKAEWRSLVDVRQSHNSADVVGEFTVFNVRGNHYRIITRIYYEDRTVLIRDVLTDAEYDRWSRNRNARE
jgi:mRNA interferase HigB